MREMVFDMVRRTSKAISGKRLSEQLRGLPPLTPIPETADDEPDLWRTRRQIGDFAQAMGAIVLIDRNMAYLGWARSGFVQRRGDGLRGKRRPVLDPARSL